MNKARILFLTSVIILLLIAGGCATTAGKAKVEDPSAGQTVITGIALSDNRVEIKGSGPFVYTIYKPSDPFRVVLDIPDVRLGSYMERMTPQVAGITEVIPSQVEMPRAMARIEILLQNPSELEPVYADNVLVLTVREAPTVKAETPTAVSSPPSPTAVAMPAPTEGGPRAMKTASKSEESPRKPFSEKMLNTQQQAALPKATEITDIRFEQGQGVVNVILKGNGSITPSVFTLRNRIVIDVPDVQMKGKVPSAVMLPVKGIRVGKHSDKVRLVLDLGEMKQFDVASVRDTLVVAIQSTEAGITVARKETLVEAPMPAAAEAREQIILQPAAPNAGEPAETKEPEAIGMEGRYTGKKISLDFQDSDILPIFRLLADISGKNIVVSPEVKGKLTMKLINVPWDQALDLILKTFSLGKSVEGNIIRIAPLAVFAKESEEKARARDAETKAEPLDTKIFRVSYADVAVVEKSIKDSKMLTARGNISVDKRTSSLVIKDAASVFPQIDSLLDTLDKPTPQVLIEARIVEVSATSVRDLGIQWGIKINAANTLSALTGFPTLGRGAFTGAPFMADFPAGSVGPGSGSGFTFGLLNPSKTFGLDLQISALETINKGRIISSPKVLTTDNEKAMIMQGTSEPYPVLTTEGTISAAYKDVVLIAEVTPHITPIGSISMNVLVRKEDVIGTVIIGGSQTPRTSKIEGNTKVLVQNGETLVIGGVYKKTERTSNSGVPYLMDIPVLGEIFKSRTINDDTAELLIFITPRILEQ